MIKTFHRPFLTVLFLLGMLAFNSLWVLVGGQYHLDLIFWPWKLGLSLVGAGLVTLMATGSRKRAWVAGVLLVVTLALAGALTYNAHLNEPAEEDEEQTEQLTQG